MSVNTNKRDIFLDVAKGFAIMLVVLGHVFQGAHKDFDDFLPFSIIYSFHMPMFFCLSGMVASIKGEQYFPYLSIHEELKVAKIELINATSRLLVPFAAWTIVSFFASHNDGTITYFKNVIKSPDWSLWFLVALFYCRIFFQLTRSIVVISQNLLSKITHTPFKKFNNIIFSAIIFAVAFLLFRKYHPYYFGLSFLKMYFPYYVFGFFIYKYKEFIFKFKKLNIVFLVIFCSLAPFWHRTSPGPIEDFLSQLLSTEKVSLLFHYTVALCGTLSFLWCVKSIVQNCPSWFNRVVAIIGSMTLGIYALHGYFLSISPAFVSALVISMIITWILQKNYILSFIFLGEKRKVITPAVSSPQTMHTAL